MNDPIAEALRYLGVGSDPEGTTRRHLEALALRHAAVLSARYVWRAYPLRHTEAGPVLAGPEVLLAGRSAARMLAHCHHAAVLTCTLGAAFDMQLRREQARDMTDAVMLDALGSAHVEAGCDAAEKEIAARHPLLHLTDRFSPGYGDFPLAAQPQLLSATDALRRLGVTLLPSLLMTPQKSVSAVIGLSDTPQPARIRGCSHCAMRERCRLRQSGNGCAEL